MQSIPHIEKLVIRGDFNGYIGSTSRGYDDVHGDFRFDDRNEGGTSLLDLEWLTRLFNVIFSTTKMPEE